MAMAKSMVLLPILCLLLLSFNSGGLPKLANGQGDRTWCVAKPSTYDANLNNNINYACDKIGEMGYNCSLIQPNGSCFTPDTPINHASVVMNFYYQLVGRPLSACYFDGSGLVTITDPSYVTDYASCQYVYISEA
ncbi:hypothetical protein COLO4_06068 [Corchorus olitorius]|uniref:X8 domain-containing protein n=1 Tax=Corchorus olitorius TaxID=93759 RepID=A0A1R3KP52_9ROSI|nr:hypothetical protein COLO4_06068 [Corchorus olitorius]